MIKLGLISNPNSQRNRRGLDGLRAAVAGTSDLLHRELGKDGGLGEILRELAGREVGLVVINGGDGTVQRALTELLEARPFERVPPLAILPRGMANMTAGDVGLRGSPGRALARLIERARRSDLERNLVRRRILRIENVAGASVQRCMFFGAAAIYDAIELCCKEVYARGLKGNLGMSLTLAGLLLGNLLGRSGRVLRGHEIGVAIDDQAPVLTRRLLVLATTLDRLILGSRPFWNQGAGSIRFTSIAHPPPQLLRSAAKVLYGWRRTSLPAGSYVSQGAERIALDLDGAFTLDGELFSPASGRPLLLSAQESVGFIRL